MSGIVGLISPDGAPVDAALLQSMTAYMDFRGPDARRTWSDSPVGLGHTLLITTFEHARERQPATLDGQVWITADARIDGRDVLKAELEAAGRNNVREATDCDLILHAYHAWGEACVEHLIGDFAFAIWDGREKKLFCARDHFGVKPFFYAQPRGGFVFSNTLKVVRLHPGLTATLNDQFVVDFLLFGFNQDVSTTAFVDIQRLAPAHCLTWRDGRVTIRRYWSIPIEELVYYKRPEEYVERFLAVFKLAVGDRLRTDNVGIYMSGGMDSASIAAVTKSQMEAGGRPYALQAYTGVCDTLPTDQERVWSKKVGDYLGIPITYLATDSFRPFDKWDQHVGQFPEPIDAPYFTISDTQLRQVGAAHRVALSGQGGDPVFYPSQSYVRRLLGRGQIATLAATLLACLRESGQLPPLYLRSWLRSRMRQPRAEHPAMAWVTPRLRELALSRAGLAYSSGPFISSHPTHTEATGLLQQPVWPYDFEVADSGINRQPVELRMPFFDVRLICSVLQIPPVPWCVNKRLLRTAMAGLLPDEVRNRPKTPWGGDSALDEPLAAAVRAAGQKGSQTRAASYLRYDLIRAEALAAHAELGDKLYSLVTAIALRNWMDAQDDLERRPGST